MKKLTLALVTLALLSTASFAADNRASAAWGTGTPGDALIQSTEFHILNINQYGLGRDVARGIPINGDINCNSIGSNNTITTTIDGGGSHVVTIDDTALTAQNPGSVANECHVVFND